MMLRVSTKGEYGVRIMVDLARHYGERPRSLTEIAQAEKKIADATESFRSGAHFLFGIERREDRSLIGTATVWNVSVSNRRADLGYALARPRWGKGYMHEALHALVDHAFGTMSLNRLEADIDPRNAASARVLEKLGFVQEGMLRERWIVNGEISDTALYGLLARTWQATKIERTGNVLP